MSSKIGLNSRISWLKLFEVQDGKGIFIFQGQREYELPVLFEIDDWDCSADGIIKYSVSPDLEVSNWDWIGLYRVWNLGVYALFAANMQPKSNF